MRRALMVLPLVFLVACGPIGAVPDITAPASDVAVPAPVSNILVAPEQVKVLPASSHVTGLPYPSHCALGKAVNGEWLPDRQCTPGAASNAVTQANIHSTICVSGYTHKVRPPVSETGPVKIASMRAYGESASSSSATELDHLVALEIGGSNDVSNLWPEPSDIAGAGFRNKKDQVENGLHAAVCAGKITLTAAQSWIASDWTTALARVPK